jgi:glutamate dehydrogenase (NAD(P)+)
VTGKPLDLHGSHGRLAATGRGCLIALREALDADGQSLNDQRIAVQGLGNVGSWFARVARAHGAKVVAVGDRRGTVVNDDGIDVEALVEHKRHEGTVRGFDGGELAAPEDVLAADCDVLVPAAIGRVLNEETAPNVQASYVLEAANGPCTIEGDAILAQRGVKCLPDIWVNAGGVTVSYFEWIQNNQHVRWDEHEVNERLQSRMVAAHEALRDAMREHDCDMRTAAFIIAVERVDAASNRRGFG